MYWCNLATSWWWSEFPTRQSVRLHDHCYYTIITDITVFPIWYRSCKQLVFWIRTSHFLMILLLLCGSFACVFTATVKCSALSGYFATMPSNVVWRVAAKRTARRTLLCKSWKRAATRGQSKEEATRRDICPYRLFWVTVIWIRAQLHVNGTNSQILIFNSLNSFIGMMSFF